MEKKVTRILLTHEKMLDNKSIILRHQNDEIAALEKELEKKTKKHSKKAQKRHTLCYYMAYFFVMSSIILAPVLFSDCHSVFDYVSSSLIILVGILLAIWNGKRISFWNLQSLFPTNKKILSLFEKIEKQRKEYFEIPENTTPISFLSPSDSEDNKNSNKTIYKIDSFEAFVRDGNLCLWNDADLCGFPLDAIESIVMVKRPLTYTNITFLPFPDEDVAKEYNIKSEPINQFITHHTIPCYGSMRIDYKEEHFEIRFPIFEAKQILKLVNYKELKRRKLNNGTKKHPHR